MSDEHSLADRRDPRHTITVPGHEPGDYLHPEQRLELIDEQNGQVYELYVRSNAVEPTGRGEIAVFIPVTAIQSVEADKTYCVVTLSRAVNASEQRARQAKLSGVLPVVTRTGVQAKARPNARNKRGRVRPATAHLKVKR